MIKEYYVELIKKHFPNISNVYEVGNVNLPRIMNMIAIEVFLNPAVEESEARECVRETRVQLISLEVRGRFDWDDVN